MCTWVDINGVMDHFGVSESTIIRWERIGMPFNKVGKVKRYDLSACDKWFTDRSGCHVR